MTAARGAGGWHVDVAGRETDPSRMPLRLDHARGDVPTLVRLLSDARSARRLKLICRGGDPVPLCLEAGFATNPDRLWAAEAEADGPRLTVRGWECPVVVTLSVGREPWALTAARPARPREFRLPVS
jgi:hypothetical protein